MNDAIVWLVIAVLLGCLAVCIVVYGELTTATPEGGAMFQGRPVQAWLDDLRSGDVHTYRDAMEALGSMGPANEDAVPELVQALDDKAPMVRAGAARALGRIGPAARHALPALESAGMTASKLDLRELIQARARIEGRYQAGNRESGVGNREPDRPIPDSLLPTP